MLLAIFIITSAYTQSNTSFFEVCNTFSESSQRSDCEKEKILDFINNEISPYLTSLKASDPDYEVRLYFDIENMGLVNNIKVIETMPPVGRYTKNEIILGKKFVPVRIPEFRKGEKYKVSFRLPEGKLPSQDFSGLRILGEKREIFKVVETMPRFPGCEKINENDMEKEPCAKEKMFKYIYDNLVYPVDARQNKIEGNVAVQFVVETDGSISEVKAVRDQGHGLGQAAVDVVESMNFIAEKWTPGKHKGKAVRVLYTLPVKFTK